MKENLNFSKIARLLSIPLLTFILWYVFLPAINLHSFEFWIYLVVNLVYTIIILITFIIIGPLIIGFRKLCASVKCNIIKKWI